MGANLSQEEASSSDEQHRHQQQPPPPPPLPPQQRPHPRNNDATTDGRAFETQQKQPAAKNSPQAVVDHHGHHHHHHVSNNNVQKVPHNYEFIIKEADQVLDRSSTDKHYDQLRSGVLLKQKKQKYWIDKNGRNCFMVFAKDLAISWGEDSRYWFWPSINDVSGDIEVSLPAAELLNVCWLEIHGKFETSKCSPGTIYEVVFVVMLKDPAYGWEVPVNLRLKLPDGTTQEHKQNLIEKPRARWIEIPVAEFRTPMTQNSTPGNLEFSLYEYEGGQWKKGLVIKGVAIRAKS